MKALHTLVETLENEEKKLKNTSVVTGFDGFVDEMISVVGTRKDLNEYERIDTIAAFGDLVKAAAGRSSLREIVVNKTEAGGCAINMGDGLASLGVNVSTFATVGAPAAHQAFSGYSKKAMLHSWGAEPGRTLAYEFSDGKLMHSAVAQLANFTPDYIQEKLLDGTFQKACSGANLIALTDWSLYPHMTACWKLLQDEVFTEYAKGTPVFLDLVDPSSRSDADIREMLGALPGFERNGPTTLGLNQNEANILASILGLQTLKENEPSAALEQAIALRQSIGISEIIIHSLKYSVLAGNDSETSFQGPYFENPVKSTGAGDRFNAGYATGLLLGLDARSRLILADSLSGLYVRIGRSPNLSQLTDFIRSCADPESAEA